MAGSVYDSTIYAKLFGDKEIGTLFTDSAEVRALVLVEGALAKAQAKCGVIPEISGAYIHRASLEIPIDGSGLAVGTGSSGVMIPALVAAFRKAMEAPEHSQYVHFGATSQDIMDTGLALRLRQTIAIYEARLVNLIKALGGLSGMHKATPMAARTWGQNATPTSFGAIFASWGWPLIGLLDDLQHLKNRLVSVSLSGAAGTLSAMGDKGPQVRAELAAGLGLNDPLRSTHTDRTDHAGFAAWMARTGAALAKIGTDIHLMAQTGIDEISLGAAGSSSTMPQKQNPVTPALLQAIATHLNGLDHAMQSATVHAQQRDGAAWITEWMSLPQMCLGLGRSLAATTDMLAILTPNPLAMFNNLDDGLGLIYAEGLSFALANHMPRPQAQEAVKSLCTDARTRQRHLRTLTQETWPDLDLTACFDAHKTLGTAPQEAEDFVKATLNLRDR
jgi:3-carboxy-cis,cis-muconate cycloisomerase